MGFRSRIVLCSNQLEGVAPAWLLGAPIPNKLVTLDACMRAGDGCTPGYFCGPTSLSESANPCPPGKWSGPSAVRCLDCPPGTYSLGAASACTPCPGGSYGSTPGLSDAGCSGLCPPGTYAPPGSSSCLECARGRYGADPGATAPLCSGECRAAPGAYCGTGMTSVTGGPAVVALAAWCVMCSLWVGGWVGGWAVVVGVDLGLALSP